MTMKYNSTLMLAYNLSQNVAYGENDEFYRNKVRKLILEFIIQIRSRRL